MPPSALPGGRKPSSSFHSVDWLSQSSFSRPTLTSRPAQVSWGRFPGLHQASSIKELPQTLGTLEQKSSDCSVQEPPIAGVSQEPEPTQGPRVHTAFTLDQVSTLEGAFQHQYLGPLKQRKLAQKMQLSEVHIKTWFQNMKHKHQMQDFQLKLSLYTAGLLTISYPGP
ncbi:LOW QUALITY PROTEIN: homeobox protein VENTX [Erethizon dorsatum]